MVVHVILVNIERYLLKPPTQAGDCNIYMDKLYAKLHVKQYDPFITITVWWWQKEIAARYEIRPHLLKEVNYD